MAWCRPSNKPLSEPVMVRLLTHMRHSASVSQAKSASMVQFKDLIYCFSLSRLVLVLLSILCAFMWSIYLCSVFTGPGTVKSSTCRITLKHMDRMDKGPFHWHFLSQYKNTGILYCCNSMTLHEVTTKFCTWFDSTTVVLFAKFYKDPSLEFGWEQDEIASNLNCDEKEVLVK